MPFWKYAEVIKKKLGRYIFHRYFKQYVKGKLSPAQFSFELHKGKITITDVCLDVKGLNELGEKYNLPIEFVDGFIRSVTVTFPWFSPLGENSTVELEGLMMTVQPKQRVEDVSMFESMWGSMMSSMQLAEQFYKTESPEEEEELAEPLAGLEQFAQAIETIFSKVVVTLKNIAVRVEQIPDPLQNYGIALEVRVDRMEYRDLISLDSEAKGIPIEQRVRERVVQSTKRITLTGTTFHTDEFSFSRGDEEFWSSSPPTMLDGAPVTMAGSPEMPPPHNRQSPSEGLSDEPSESDPILISQLAKEQEILVKLKLDESLTGPNVAVEFNLGQMAFFLSPRQVNLLLELAKGFYSPGSTSSAGTLADMKVRSKCKPMDPTDFARVHQDLQRQLSSKKLPTRSLGSHSGWSTHSLDSDDEYQPMTRQRAFVDSGSNLTSDMDSSASSVSYHAAPKPKQRTKKKRSTSKSSMEDTLVELTHFHVRCNALYVVILHDDLLVGKTVASNMCPSSHTAAQMRSLAEGFFRALEGHCLRDLNAMREVLLRTCRSSHLRIAATPFNLDGTEKSSAAQWSLGVTVAVGELEVVEFVDDHQSDVELASSSTREVQYNEILTAFQKTAGTSEDEPLFRLRCEHVEKTSQTRGVREPCTSVIVELGAIQMEVDRSLVDRIYALLHPPSQFSSAKHKQAEVWSMSLNQNEQHSSLSACKTNIRVHSPFVKVNLRFPVPDLRPEHDMNRAPWWQRNVRPDVLSLELTEPTLSTTFEDADSDLRLVLVCREAHAMYQDSPLASPVSFLRVFHDPKMKEDGFNWPRMEICISPDNKLSPLEMEEDAMLPSMMDTMLMQVERDLDSPFATRQVFYNANSGGLPNTKDGVEESDEVILPGDKATLRSFIEKTSGNCRVLLDLSLPSVSLCFPDKHFYEKIYNRLTMDLVLWEPMVPTAKWNVDTGSGIRVPFLAQDLQSHILQEGNFESFSMCRSGLRGESDEDEDETTSVFHSVCESRRSQQQTRQPREKAMMHGQQSQLVLNIQISEGMATLVTPLRDAQGNVIPQHHGEMQLVVGDAQLLMSASHHGDPLVNYILLTAATASLHHKGQVSGSPESVLLRPMSLEPSTRLLPVLYKSKPGVAPQPSSFLSEPEAVTMLSLVIKTTANPKEGVKTIKVAAGINGTTLRHRMSPLRQSWVKQFVDFFDVQDYPILGYTPLGVVTELHLNLCNCAVDYRPLYIPYQAVATMENFSISSNVTVETGSSSSSLLRVIAEEACLYVSDKVSKEDPNLAKDYVCVVDTGLVDITVRMMDRPEKGQPELDLRASNNIVHVRTCADSCRALQCLLTYFASDGDLVEESSASTGTSTPEKLSSLLGTHNDHFHSLMAEAMRESSGSGSLSPSSDGDSPPSFMRVDSSDNNDEDYDDAYEEARDHDSEPYACRPVAPAAVQRQSSAAPRRQRSSSPDEEFCILEDDPGTGIVPRSGEPQMRLLVSDPIRVVECHFTAPTQKTDQLGTPKHFPMAIQKYTLSEMSLVWHLFGGSDFGTPRRTKLLDLHGEDDDPFDTCCGSVILEEGFTTASFSKHTVTVEFPQRQASETRQPMWTGGPGRRKDVLMELQMNKVRFRHETYPEDTLQASRQVLLIHDVEVRDRLAASQLNKFLYQYTSESLPRQSHANMVVLKMVHIRPDLNCSTQECSVRVSLKPLRFNIDQDALLFLYEFFSDVSSTSPTSEFPDTPRAGATPEKHVRFPEDARLSTCDVSSVETGQLLILTKNEEKETDDLVSPAGSISGSGPKPLFIRSFVFAPDVPIRVDYHGKRVAMEKGTLAGLLMGLGQLNCLEITLKKLTYRQGLLGVDKLLALVLNDWLNDIKKNQVPSVLGGVGPMHSFVQLFNGIRDLVWLPVEQYRRDGRIVRGLQRGANSFTSSTAMACLELTNKFVQTVQGAAELAYNMLSPGPSLKEENRGRHHYRAITNAQPVDIREGVTNAYHVVAEGLGDAARNLVQAASQEHRHKGVSGAVGGVLRQLPPTMVRPIILATEATSSVLGGVRNQMVPEARQEAVHKWRQEPKTLAAAGWGSR